MNSFDYFELVLQASKQNPESLTRITDFLMDCGVVYTDLAFFETGNRHGVRFYTPSSARVKKIKQRLKGLGSGLRFSSKLLRRADWFDKWERDYKIMKLGKRYLLVPLWRKKEAAKLKSPRKFIYMDPKGASGSGQHASTQLMTRLIENAECSSALDLGCGTGILAIVLAKQGAEKILAIDNDAVAVRSAKFNLKLNGIKRARVQKRDVTGLAKGEKYDMVCANLVSALLEKIQPFLFNSVKPGGYLAVSGIIKKNFPAFQKKFKHPRFACLRKLQYKNWAGMLFQRHS